MPYVDFGATETHFDNIFVFLYFFMFLVLVWGCPVGCEPKLMLILALFAMRAASHICSHKRNPAVIPRIVIDACTKDSGCPGVEALSLICENHVCKTQLGAKDKIAIVTQQSE